MQNTHDKASGALLSRLSAALPRRLTRAVRSVSRPLAECWASEEGASVLETAIVLPLFFVLFIGMFQYGIIFATQSLLDNATRDAARQIRIGTISGSSYSSSLATVICNDLTVTKYSLVPNCTTNIQIYVAAATTGSPSGSGFTSLTPTSVNNGVMTQTKAALAGKYDVLLQAGVQLPWAAVLFTGNAMLLSSQAFQTEPY